jgi:hypothetical protein
MDAVVSRFCPAVNLGSLHKVANGSKRKEILRQRDEGQTASKMMVIAQHRKLI